MIDENTSTQKLISIQYNLIDEDSNKQIECVELCEYLNTFSHIEISDLNIDQILSLVNLDGKDNINQPEFNDFMTKELELPFNIEAYLEFFKFFDPEATGKIYWPMLERNLGKFGEYFQNTDQFLQYFGREYLVSSHQDYASYWLNNFGVDIGIKGEHIEEIESPVIRRVGEKEKQENLNRLRQEQEERDRLKKEREELRRKKLHEEEGSRRRREKEEADRFKLQQEEEQISRRQQEEDQRRRRQQEEDDERRRRQQEEDDERRRRQQEEEDQRRRQEEDERIRKEEEEDERIRKEEEEQDERSRRQQEEEDERRRRQQEEDDLRRKKEEDERRRRQQEEDEKRRQDEDLGSRRQQEEEDERIRRQLEEDDLRRKQEEDQRIRRQQEEEDERRRCQQEEDDLRKKKEEDENRKKKQELDDEKRRKKQEEDEERRRRYLEEEELRRKQQEEEELRRKQEEEEDNKKKLQQAENEKPKYQLPAAHKEELETLEQASLAHEISWIGHYIDQGKKVAIIFDNFQIKFDGTIQGHGEDLIGQFKIEGYVDIASGVEKPRVRFEKKYALAHSQVYDGNMYDGRIYGNYTYGNYKASGQFEIRANAHEWTGWYMNNNSKVDCKINLIIEQDFVFGIGFDQKYGNYIIRGTYNPDTDDIKLAKVYFPSNVIMYIGKSNRINPNKKKSIVTVTGNWHEKDNQSENGGFEIRGRYGQISTGPGASNKPSQSQTPKIPDSPIRNKNVIVQELPARSHNQTPLQEKKVETEEEKKKRLKEEDRRKNQNLLGLAVKNADKGEKEGRIIKNPLMARKSEQVVDLESPSKVRFIESEMESPAKKPPVKKGSLWNGWWTLGNDNTTNWMVLDTWKVDEKNGVITGKGREFEGSFKIDGQFKFNTSSLDNVHIPFEVRMTINENVVRKFTGIHSINDDLMKGTWRSEKTEKSGLFEWRFSVPPEIQPTKKTKEEKEPIFETLGANLRYKEITWIGHKKMHDVDAKKVSFQFDNFLVDYDGDITGYGEDLTGDFDIEGTCDINSEAKFPKILFKQKYKTGYINNYEGIFKEGVISGKWKSNDENIKGTFDQKASSMPWTGFWTVNGTKQDKAFDQIVDVDFVFGLSSDDKNCYMIRGDNDSTTNKIIFGVKTFRGGIQMFTGDVFRINPNKKKSIVTIKGTWIDQSNNLGGEFELKGKYGQLGKEPSSPTKSMAESNKTGN